MFFWGNCVYALVVNKVFALVASMRIWCLPSLCVICLHWWRVGEMTVCELCLLVAPFRIPFQGHFSWIESFVSWFEIHWSFRFQLTISGHWVRQWPVTEQATNHNWPCSLMHICGTWDEFMFALVDTGRVLTVRKYSKPYLRNLGNNRRDTLLSVRNTFDWAQYLRTTLTVCSCRAQPNEICMYGRVSRGSLPRVRRYGLLYLRTVEYDHCLVLNVCPCGEYGIVVGNKGTFFI